MFGNLPSSPDLFQLPSIDSATSPSFFPQHRLFWDGDLEHQSDGIGLPGSSADPFDSNTTHSFDITNDPISISNIPPLPAIDNSMHGLSEFSGSNEFCLTSAAPDNTLLPAPFSTSPRLPMTRLLEDPAMFLSSPARRFGPPQPTPGKRLFPRETRQPYHHQTEESKREELRRARSRNTQPSGSSLSLAADDDDDDDDYTPRKLRPGMARSVTHNAVLTGPSHRRPPLNPSLSSGMMSSTSGIRKSPSKGRSSPLKSLRERQLSPAHSVASGFSTRSQSLVLKIGKDGRAKTEMQIVTEPAATGLTDPITAMDINGSVTEDESDLAEYSDYPILHSHHPSFAFSDAGRSVYERSESGSRPHSKCSSYSSSTAHSGRLSPWAGSSRGGSRRPQYRPVSEDWQRTPTKRPSALANPDLTYNSPSTTDDQDDEDTGDAQHALRQVLKGRGRNLKHHIVSGYRPRGNRRSLAAAHLRSSPPPRFGGELDLRSRDSNASPTTITDPDLATPSTNRHSNPSNGTRCICNSMDNGGHLMIQW